MPLLSVVIPTHRRPRWLSGAVASALASECNGDVEVIVVPNGADDTWQYSLGGYADDHRVRIAPIDTPHANVARNAGAALARGEFIRFLDDDDELDAGISTLQIQVLRRSGAEICSGAVRVVDESGALLHRLQQRDSLDLVCAMARPRRVCLPTAHLFRRSAIADERWDETLPYEQDTDWMLRLCESRERAWASIPDDTGLWRQHGSGRTSKSISHHVRARTTVIRFFQALTRLDERGALDATRRDAFAEGLWEYVHHNFPKAPWYWTLAARRTRSLAPHRMPPDPFFSRRGVRAINPLVLEWLLLPKRWINIATRRGDDR